MKFQLLDKYYVSAVILLLASFILIAIPLILNIGDTTTAACVIVGMVLVMTGSIILSLSGGEPMDPRLVGILSAQGSLTLCRISSDRGINGNAHFLPKRFTGEMRVMQLNPVAENDGSRIPADTAFLETEPGSFITIPSGDLLIQELSARNAMAIPNKSEELTVLLKETIGDIFNFASRISTEWNRNRVTITLYDYQFIESCKILAQTSPQCCRKYPCPVCSLCGILIAEGMDTIIILERCSYAASSCDLIITFMINSLSHSNT